jgi:hypothetical protein
MSLPFLTFGDSDGDIAMSVDLVAILRIANMPVPRSPVFANVPDSPVLETGMVEHRTDATLYHTFDKFSASDPDEHALHLRRVLGAALDAHDDPRGIMCFPDVCEPRAGNYAALVDEVWSAGFWAPVVALDYIPLRYTAARPGTHEAFVAQLIGVMGRDEAISFDGALLGTLAFSLQPGADDSYIAVCRQMLDQVGSVLGAEFADRYDVSLRELLKREEEAANRYREEAPKIQAEAIRRMAELLGLRPK